MSKPAPEPCYSSISIESRAYHLRFGWTGWFSDTADLLKHGNDAIERARPLWEEDGIRVLECRWDPAYVQMLCSVQPKVSPTFFTGRIKGRLQHAFRSLSYPVEFQRKVSFRTIGENRRDQVESYIAKQVSKECFADSRFESLVQKYTCQFSDVDLSRPTETVRGRYWYNLHLVLVMQDRARFIDAESLEKLSGWCGAIAAKKGYQISWQSVMPDHIHLSLRGNIEHGPEEIALGFMNNLVYAFGQNPIFSYGYYVGSFGEYDMGAIREK